MFELKKRVHFEDVDYYGIIHHPKVLYYFERARNLFFEANNIFLDRVNYSILLKKIEIDYKCPLMMYDEIVIKQCTDKMNDYKFSFKYKIFKQTKLSVNSTIEFVVVDSETKKMMILPDEIKKILSADGVV